MDHAVGYFLEGASHLGIDPPYGRQQRTTHLVESLVCRPTAPERKSLGQHLAEHKPRRMLITEVVSGAPVFRIQIFRVQIFELAFDLPRHPRRCSKIVIAL